MSTAEASRALRMPPLMFAALAGTMAMMAYVAVIGPLARELGLPEWAAGLSITAGGVFWMGLARWWGGVSDRHGRKRVLLIGFAVLSIAYLVLAVGIEMALRQQFGAAATIAMLVITRSVIGGVYAAVPPSAAALIADHTPPQERPARMARLGTANAIGMVAGPAVAGGLAAYDLGLALYAAAALPALALLVVWRLLPHGGAGAPKKAQSVSLFDPRLRLPSVAALVAMGSVSIAQVLVGFFAIDRLGLDTQAGAHTAGLALTAVGMALIASQQFVMRLKSTPLLRWIWVGALVAASGFAGVALVQTQAQLLLCYGIAAFGMGLIFPSFQALAANAVQPHEQGIAAGTISAAQGLGMVLGPVTGTLLYRLSPSLPYLLVGGLLLGLSLAVGMRRRDAGADAPVRAAP